MKQRFEAPETEVSKVDSVHLLNLSAKKPGYEPGGDLFKPNNAKQNEATSGSDIWKDQ